MNQAYYFFYFKQSSFAGHLNVNINWKKKLFDIFDKKLDIVNKYILLVETNSLKVR